MRFSTSNLAILALLSLSVAPPVRADEVQTHLQKAGAAANQKDWDTALAEIDAAIALDNNNVDAHAARVIVLMQKQDVTGAITELGRVIVLDPKNANAYKMRASLYKRAGDNEHYQADYISYLRLSPDEVVKLQGVAQAATDKHDTERAANLWTLLSQIRPDDAHIQYSRGLALKKFLPEYSLLSFGNDKAEANIAKIKADTAASFEAAIKADPNFVPAYIALDDPVALERGLKIVPQSADLLAARAEMATRGLPDDNAVKGAIEDASHAIAIDPKCVVAYAARAHAYERKKDYDQALADSTRALELDPKNFETLQLRGSIYAKKDDYEHCAADYERALAIKPYSEEVTYIHYWALSKLPDKTRALAAITKMIADKPGDDYQRTRAELYFEMKDYAHALEDVDKSLTRDPKNKAALDLRAKIVAAQK